jgi:hypothetical protein
MGLIRRHCPLPSADRKRAFLCDWGMSLEFERRPIFNDRRADSFPCIARSEAPVKKHSRNPRQLPLHPVPSCPYPLAAALLRHRKQTFQRHVPQLYHSIQSFRHPDRALYRLRFFKDCL